MPAQKYSAIYHARLGCRRGGEMLVGNRYSRKAPVLTDYVSRGTSDSGSAAHPIPLRGPYAAASRGARAQTATTNVSVIVQ
jgi:hypothetical protein